MLDCGAIGPPGGYGRGGTPGSPAKRVPKPFTVDGFVDRRFERLGDAFFRQFAESRDELGAALAVVVEGATGVDLWAGFHDAARTHPWERDTIVNIAPAGKGPVAACAHVLVERGLLELDVPVSGYWPEFGRAGKEAIVPAEVLSHRAGLPALRAPLPAGSLYDWQRMVIALAEERPRWPPGTRHGYHAVTFGFLVGELVRRVSGRSIGTFWRDEIAEPLGIDLHIGLPRRDDERVAWCPPAVAPEDGFDPFQGADPESMPVKAFTNPADLTEPGVVNTTRWRRAEIPASNGHGNALALARFYGALAAGGELDGVRILSPTTIEAATAERSSGIDAVLGMRTASRSASCSLARCASSGRAGASGIRGRAAASVSRTPTPGSASATHPAARSPPAREAIRAGRLSSTPPTAAYERRDRARRAVRAGARRDCPIEAAARAA